MNTAAVENRESFFARLRPIMAPSDLLKVEVAYALAKHAHRHQERKELDSSGNPIRYFEHLRGTALVAIDELGINDPDIIIACLMHDAIEDTNDISATMLEHLFGANVARMVLLLTKTESNKHNYFLRLDNYGDPATLVVKGCDRLHNLRSMKDCSPDFIWKQIKETEEHVLPIIHARADHDLDASHSAAVSVPVHRISKLIACKVRELKNELSSAQ